jgi:hypothetical protein
MIHSPIHESIDRTSYISHSSIHTLNDGELLNIFHLYRLDVQCECQHENFQCNIHWDDQRWWYKLARVCLRWRHLILTSPSYLDLHVFCTYGVPVSDMLTYSPPLPIIIDYWDNDREITAEDEEGIFLALSHRDRVRRIRFWMPTPNLRKFIKAIDGQFQILERLYIVSQTQGSTALVFPETFQAPNLRRIGLWKASISIGSPILTTTAGLATLIVANIPQSHLPPTYLLNGLSLMHQLEVLVIDFHSPLPNHDVKAQLLHTPNMIQVTLPSLRQFWFTGKSVYLEGIAVRIDTPVLSNIQVRFFNQLTFTIPRLSQFIHASGNLSFRAIWLDFLSGGFALGTEYQGKSTTSAFTLCIVCGHLDWQVSSAVQILSSLQPVLSVVEQLTLRHEQHNRSAEWHNVVDRTQWHDLLRPFSNVKTLHVQNELVGKISCSLRTDDGQPPLELLPNLKELGYSGGSYARDAFAPFVDGRQLAGHSVNLVVVGQSVFGRRSREPANVGSTEASGETNGDSWDEVRLCSSVYLSLAPTSIQAVVLITTTNISSQTSPLHSHPCRHELRLFHR